MHSELEKFRTPAPLIGRETPSGRLGQKLGPIFRDRSDLAASGDLGRAIHEELSAARFLIVLCTPAAAASRWVNAEIEAFHQLGRSDTILPILARGLPRRFDPVSCPEGAFPPALLAVRAEEPFAPDMRAVEDGGDGLEMARLKVIAAITRIPLAELTQRHVAAERVRRRRATAVAAAMVVLALGTSVAGTVAWRQSERANARLIEAIETAARQVETAAQFRDRFGVSTTILAELYEGATRDFGSLVTEAAEAPRLRLAQLRLNLELAAFARRAEGGAKGSSKYLVEAQALLEMLRAPPPLSVRVGLVDGVGADELAVGMSSYLKAISLERLRLGDAVGAVAAAEGANAIAGLPSTAQLSALCHLSEIRYRTDDLEGAELDKRACVDSARTRSETTRNPFYMKTLVAELADYAKVLRALLRYTESFEAQAEAAKHAAALESRAGSDLSAAAIIHHAHLLYGDALTAAGRLDDAQRSFQAALSIAIRGSSGNPTRTDWKRNHALALERLASASLQSLCTLGAAERSLQFATAQQQIAESISLIETLLYVDPLNSVWLRDLAAGLQVQAELLSSGSAAAGQWPTTAEAALDAAKEAVATREALWKASSGEVHLQNLAAAQATLALISARSGAAATETYFDKAREAYDTLLATKNRDLWQAERLMLAAYHAKFLAETARSDEALAVLANAKAEAEALAKRHPDAPVFTDLVVRLPTMLAPPHLGEPPC
ncbi:TIR domain-containing protein [Paracoccus tibetensis]|uniref:TIR domain-containing protein n=2 Tax=Paracoccus tibetensis TaxID=336292 RepID=A0A1G5K1M6_9RHOB|nr:TIR domain-containing protein [Paracoccus tibetensis]